MSLNGQIARKNGVADFVSAAEWKSYAAHVRNRVLIIGRKTYEIMIKYKEFSRIKPRAVVVVSSRKNLKIALPNHSLAASPQKAILVARKIKAKEVIIGGGTKLNSAFLKGKLVDEVILDVEPILVGDGIPLFKGTSDVKLKLLAVKKLNTNLLQLKYKVS